MIKKNVMTMSMFLRIFFKFQLDQDMEDLKEGYEEMLDLVSEAGYEGVDVTSWETGILGTDYVKHVLNQRNLKVSSFIYPEKFASMDEEGLEDRVKRAERGADTAAELGTSVFMLVPQAQENIEEYEPEQIRRSLIRHWTPVAAYAKKLGLHVVIEDTPDLKLCLCRKEEVREVLDAVEGLELVYDSANMILTGEDPVEYLEAFKDRIGYVHLKDYRIAPPGSMVKEYAEDGTAMASAPTGTGMIDLESICRKLDEIGYDGEMTVEFRVDDNSDYKASLVRSREYVTKQPAFMSK